MNNRKIVIVSCCRHVNGDAQIADKVVQPHELTHDSSHGLIL